MRVSLTELDKLYSRRLGLMSRVMVQSQNASKPCKMDIILFFVSLSFVWLIFIDTVRFTNSYAKVQIATRSAVISHFDVLFIPYNNSLSNRIADA
jgi:hypothetical protein